MQKQQGATPSPLLHGLCLLAHPSVSYYLYIYIYIPQSSPIHNPFLCAFSAAHKSCTLTRMNITYPSSCMAPAIRLKSGVGTYFYNVKALAFGVELGAQGLIGRAGMYVLGGLDRGHARGTHCTRGGPSPVSNVPVQWPFAPLCTRVC